MSSTPKYSTHARLNRGLNKLSFLQHAGLAIISLTSQDSSRQLGSYPANKIFVQLRVDILLANPRILSRIRYWKANSRPITSTMSTLAGARYQLSGFFIFFCLLGITDTDDCAIFATKTVKRKPKT